MQLTGTDSLAHQALNLIGAIYNIEDKCRNMHYERRYYFRKKYLRKLYRKLHSLFAQIPNTPSEERFRLLPYHYKK